MITAENIEKIFDVTVQDRKNKQERMLKTIEENGELAANIISFLHVSGTSYKKIDFQDIFEEMADVFLCLYSSVAQLVPKQIYMNTIMNIKEPEIIKNINKKILTTQMLTVSSKIYKCAEWYLNENINLNEEEQQNGFHALVVLFKDAIYELLVLVDLFGIDDEQLNDIISLKIEKWTSKISIQ